MARRSPAVDRTVAVLNHLAASPRQRFTLSELARDLDLNKATAHALLATMVDVGYLVRHADDKTYALGPALIALGNAALDAYPAATFAQEPMARLSAEFDLECVASTAIAGEIVILASSGVPRPLGINVQPGLRLPLVPPLGTVFVAWSGAREIDAWLNRLGPDASDDDLDRYRQALEVVRQRGFSVGLGGDEQQRLVESLSSPSGRQRPPAARGEEYALVELGDSAPHTINHIGAPVFGPDGKVALALFLIGFRGQIRADEVPRYAERLVEEAMTVTQGLRGVVPVV
jgi:DNA-binding IclR family transcriptional regulator